MCKVVKYSVVASYGQTLYNMVLMYHCFIYDNKDGEYTEITNPGDGNGWQTMSHGLGKVI